MRNHRAFTLAELLIVIAIIAVLVALLLPVASKVRQQALGVQCTANLRTVGQVLLVYVTSNDGYLPPGNCNLEASPNTVWSILGKIPFSGKKSGYSVGYPASGVWCPAANRPTAEIDGSWCIFDGGPIDYWSSRTYKNYPWKKLTGRVRLPSETAFLQDRWNYSFTDNVVYNYTATPYQQKSGWRHANLAANTLYFDGHVAPMFPKDFRVMYLEPGQRRLDRWRTGK